MKKRLFIASVLFIFILVFSVTQAFALPEGFVPTPEIINPQGSRFCTEFKMGYKEESGRDELNPVPTAPAASGNVLGAGEAEVAGELRMTKEKLPDFSPMEQDATSALDKLLPQDLKDILSIQGNSLAGKAKHFVLGKQTDESFQLPSENREIPETNTTYPSWLAQLIGKTKLMCGMFGSCPAPISPDIRVQPFAAKVGSSSYKTICDLNSAETVEKDPEIAHVQPKFKTKSQSIIDEIVDWIKDQFGKIIGKRFTTIKTTTLKDITSGVWPASNFRQYSSFQNAFIPQDFLNKNGTLKGEAEFSVTHAIITPGADNRVNFQNFGLTRLQRCMQLCSIHPVKIAVSIDPMCTSCDIEDYQMKEPVLDKTPFGQWTGNGYEYCWAQGVKETENCEEDSQCGCGTKPIYDGEKYCPLQYKRAYQYIQNGCQPPYWDQAGDCTSPSVCQEMHFEPNPGGGFGPCQYLNPKVCVRVDQLDIGNCATTCTWDCCASQQR